MNGHDVRDVPEEVRAKLISVTTACFRCGLFNPNERAQQGAGTCNELYLRPVMKVYQAGGDSDPFAGYRDNCMDGSTETRPGLVHETIDRDAYDSFMRTL